MRVQLHEEDIVICVAHEGPGRDSQRLEGPAYDGTRVEKTITTMVFGVLGPSGTDMIWWPLSGQGM